MLPLRNYEIVVILNEQYTNIDLKTWVFNYTKALKIFQAWEISVLSLGKRKLAYQIQSSKNGHYLQVNFSSVPRYLLNFLKSLNDDLDVINFMLVKTS